MITPKEFNDLYTYLCRQFSVRFALNFLANVKEVEIGEPCIETPVSISRNMMNILVPKKLFNVKCLKGELWERTKANIW